MADTNQYRLLAVKLGTSVWSSVVGESVRLSPAINHLFTQPGGRINIASHAVVSAAPIMEVDAYKIDLVTGPTLDTVVGIFESATDAGGSGATYISFSASCIAIPQAIQADRNGEAKLSVRFILLSSDGTSDPITVGTTSETLVTTNDLFTVGASSVAGSAVQHIISQGFQFGYTVETDEGNSGNIYPTTTFITSQAPVINVTTQDLGEATSARVNGGEVVDTAAADLTWQHLNGGSNVSVSITKGVIEAETQGGAPASAALTISGIDDDTDDSTFVSVT